MMRRLSSALAALFSLAWASDVAAFCRATTCDPGDPTQHCQVDGRTQCVQTGAPLYWSSSCVTFSVNEAAAPRAGIDYSTAKASLQRALDAWTSADCGGKAPSLHATLSEPVSCDASEYNRDAKNANIVIFRQDEWPYEGGEDALGLTRVRFDIEDNVGELYDADIEINAVSEPLSAGEPAADEVDLDSLMTHEVGHGFGLAHSLDLQATMLAGYVTGSIGLRSLGDDDVAGICDAYPPTRKPASASCEPRHGFSTLCGAEQPPAATPTSQPVDEPAPGSSSCSVGSGSPREGALGYDGWSAWAAVGLGMCLRRLRKNGPNPKGGPGGSTDARDSV